MRVLIRSAPKGREQLIGEQAEMVATSLTEEGERCLVIVDGRHIWLPPECVEEIPGDR
ncbi:MAG: hypothetical protein WDA72_01395 [Desulfomonilia bacterium]